MVTETAPNNTNKKFYKKDTTDDYKFFTQSMSDTNYYKLALKQIQEFQNTYKFKKVLDELLQKKKEKVE